MEIPARAFLDGLIGAAFMDFVETPCSRSRHGGPTLPSRWSASRAVHSRASMTAQRHSPGFQARTDFDVMSTALC